MGAETANRQVEQLLELDEAIDEAWRIADAILAREEPDWDGEEPSALRSVWLALSLSSLTALNLLRDALRQEAESR